MATLSRARIALPMRAAFLPSTIRFPTHVSRCRERAGGAEPTQGGAVADQVRAYILIQTVTNAAHVAREIRNLEGIESADDVSGPYDVIVRLTASDMDDLGKSVVTRIQAIEGISRTLTCPVVQL